MATNSTNVSKSTRFDISYEVDNYNLFPIGFEGDITILDDKVHFTSFAGQIYISERGRTIE